jgi:hypothetical protein
MTFGVSASWFSGKVPSEKAVLVNVLVSPDHTVWAEAKGLIVESAIGTQTKPIHARKQEGI